MTEVEYIDGLTPGVLAKQDLAQLFDQGKLLSNIDLSKLEACSYDLRIGTIFKDGKIFKDRQEDFAIQPGEILNIFTLEELNLPKNIMAIVYPINNQSSRGLLVLNPGHIDPGYKGPVTVKAVNLRKVPLPIYVGMEIFTVIFHVLPKSTTSPYNKSELSRDRKEKEFNKVLIEQDTNNISELVSMESGSPYPTKAEVNELIRKHWSSWLAVGLAATAALAGIASVVITLTIALKSS